MQSFELAAFRSMVCELEDSFTEWLKTHVFELEFALRLSQRICKLCTGSRFSQKLPATRRHSDAPELKLRAQKQSEISAWTQTHSTVTAHSNNMRDLHLQLQSFLEPKKVLLLTSDSSDLHRTFSGNVNL